MPKTRCRLALGALAGTAVSATNLLWREGELFVADTFNNAIRKVQQLGPDEGWLVSTVAGGGGRGFEDGVG